MQASNPTKLRIIDALDLRTTLDCGFAPAEYMTLRTCGQNGTLQVFLDPLERPVGYVAWANVGRATIDRLRRSGKGPKYPGEWNEGGICLLLDVLISPHGKHEAMRQLRRFIRQRRAVVFLGRGKRLRVYLRTRFGFVKHRAV